MSCIHVDTSGKLLLPSPVKWEPTGRVNAFFDDYGHTKVQTWLRCGHCGNPGYMRDGSRVVYTWRSDP